VIEVGVAAPSRSYRVLVGRRLLGRVGDLWRPLGDSERTLVVCDENVAPLYLQPLQDALAAAGQRVTPVVLPAGESEKNLERLSWLYGVFYDERLSRSDAVVALGGGVIGDLAGCAAATYLRGVRFVQVPTTLLAMVDAAVGGKVAVDYRAGKNHVGTFYQPWLVVADLDTLSTLPEREARCGWAEVVKYALLDGRELLADVERTVGADGGLPDEDTIAACVRRKVEIVVSDEREESGERALLNLGHTIGHAIEAATAFSRYSHGEAVALGLRATLWLSERLAGLPAAAAERGQRLLSAAGLPQRLEGVDRGMVTALVGRDKKAAAGGVRYVLLADLGVPVRDQNVPDELVEEVTEWLTSR
jgi:3-dehydroquinate synthase